MKSNSLSDRVGWTVFESPKTLAQWDSSFMALLSIRAPDMELSPKSDSKQLSDRVGSICRSLGHRWTWHFESQQTKISAYQESEWPSLVSALLDAERKDSCLADGAQFEMRHYLTLTQAPAITAALGSAMVGGQVEDQTVRDRRRDAFERQVSDIVSALEATGMRVDWLKPDRGATFLKSTCSTNHHKVNAEEHGVLSDSLPDQRFQRGFRMSKLGDDYLAVLTLGALPKRTHPQLLAKLSALKFEFRWVTRWVGMDRAAARALLRKREDQALGAAISLKDVVARKVDGLLSGGQRSIRGDVRERVDREELKRADDAAAGLEKLSERGLGHMTVVFVVWDKSRRLCDQKRAELMTAIQDCELTVRHEIIEPLHPWLMSLPGNRLMTRRTHVVNTRNLADLLPTSSSFRGNPHDAQLAKTTGVRRAWLYTPGKTYRLNSDSKGGAAHTLVFGRTGEAGKSTLLNHMALQFFGWPKAQVISLATGRSEYGPCLMSGGAVYAPGSRDEAALQPLANVDQPDEAVQAVEWLEECVAAMGEPVTTEIRSALADMVKALGTEPPERRTMTSLVNLLGSRLPPLAEVLKPFSHYGMYGHIFDGKSSAWDWKPWTMIELAPLLALSNKVSGPALSHIFRRIYKRFDGRPTAIFADEAPDWLHLPGVERQLIRIFDTQRKNAVRLVLFAQTPGQLLKFPDLMKSVKSAATSRIYGPDSEALTQTDEYKEFGVSQTALERIKRLQLDQYLHATSKGMRVFDLHAGPIALALTTMSSPEELAFLAELRANGCDGDEIVRTVLRRKGLEKRARSLGVWDSATTTALAAE